MKKYFILISLIFAVISLQFFACKKEPKPNPLPVYTPTPYTLAIPPNFPAPLLSDSNPMTVEGIKLGRMLYYDPILSTPTNNLSCSSCHNQDNSFGAGYIILSGETLCVKPHINLAWNPYFLWDGSEPNPESVCMLDFGPAFFNTDVSQLKQKLKNNTQYSTLFYQAFNITDIAILSDAQLKVKIVEAISQFIRTLVSCNSKFDKFARHEVQLNPSEMNGYIIYMTEKGDCYHCHGTILFTDHTFNNNGLNCTISGQDSGRYLYTHNTSDIGKFLAPTLRNIALRPPYMHDGRFKTLQEVVDFYNSGVCLTSPNIDPLMTLPYKVNGLQLQPQDKIDLINFLNTLTDSTFITNPAYSSPF